MDLILQPIVIKVEEDVIDLDNFLSVEERITNWNSRVRDEIKKSLRSECEKTSLENLMKSYIKILNEDIFNKEINNSFLLLMEKHLNYFYSYFKELNWISMDDYLDLMEDILAFYLDCHGNVFIKEKLKQKRNKKRMRKRLLTILRIYLLNQEDRILHVLLKMRLNLSNQDAKNYLDNVYRIILSQIPKDKSDTAFCRAYILYQKWKKIQVPENWKALDDLLDKMYSRLPDSINTNNIWQEILQHRNSLMEILAEVGGDHDHVLCEAYFKFRKWQTHQENLDALNNIDQITSDDNIGGGRGGEENDDFLNIIGACTDDERIIKSETDNDEDCVIIAEGSIEINSNEIVYEILDDDDDDDKVKDLEEPSFLDSIDITEKDLNKETNTTKTPSPTATATDSISRLVPKLNNSNNDSVKSREILSRKFTRKKINPNETITIEEDNNVEVEILHMPHSTFVNNNSPKSTTTEILSGSYASPTSPDISTTCDPDGRLDEDLATLATLPPLDTSTPLINNKNNGISVKLNEPEKIVVRNENVEKKMEIVYAQKATIPNHEVHLRYNDLKDGHGLEDFDLFADNIPPPKENHIIESSSPQNLISSSTNSPTDLISPEYDGIDDFRNYLTSYQQENNKKKQTETENTTQFKSILKKPRINNNNNNNKKPKRINFSNNIIIHEVPRIPLKQMNLKSLAYYKVKPNDSCLQGNPQVIIETLSEMEIKGWKNISENSRKNRLEQPKNSPSMMNLIQVNYDKSTPDILNNDTVHFNVKDEWRSSKIADDKDEGRLVHNGRKNGKRKIQNTSDDGYGCRKRGRPKKKT